MPYCRVCNRKEKPAFGTGPRKPLANRKREQTRMSAEAEVQDDVAGRCILLGFMAGDCGVKLQRCHIVSQELIRDTYPYGAYRAQGDEFWIPIPRTGVPLVRAEKVFTGEGFYGDIEGAFVEQITLQQILDMSANLVHGCENHNKDGLEMVEALDARKVAGVPSYPAGFGEFTHAFRFSIEGSTHWYYVAFEEVA